MRVLPYWLLTGCVENNLNKADQDPAAFDSSNSTIVDTSTTDTALPPEACNGLDDNGDGSVDEGFPDDDGNGRADCLDLTCDATDLGTPGTVSVVTECEGGVSVTVKDPWNVAIEYQYTSSGSGVIVMPAVGNLNDDDGTGSSRRCDQRT